MTSSIPTYEKRRSSGMILSIEGLRAIAVVAVILFHLDLSYFSGGYVGVDIFFVISGFIITRNILNGIEKGAFSFSDFYLRRFRRLVPSLVAVVLVTLIAGFYIVPPSDFAAAGESGLYSIFSASNILFWWEADYFDVASHSKPFLHTWSLAVEEQFYLIWPILLVFVRKRNATLVIVLALGIASILSAGLFVKDYPSAVFYLAPFRIYQFMAGALIATAGWSLRGVLADMIHCLALTALVLVVIFISGDTSTVVSGGLAAGLGAFLLLTRDSKIGEKIVGNRASVWVGQRSYALYLVHWPLIVLYKYWQGQALSPVAQITLVCATIVFAIVLHEAIEKPFRIRSTARPWRLGTAATAIGVLIVSFGAANIWGHQGFEQRIPGEISRLIDNVGATRRAKQIAIRKDICHFDERFERKAYNARTCAGIEAGKTNVLVIGDSVAADIYMMLVKAYPSVRFAQATASDCPPLFDYKSTSNCEALNELRLNELAKRNFDFIVLGARWNSSNVLDMAKTIDRLRALGKRLVLFGPPNTFSEDVPRLIATALSLDDADGILRRSNSTHHSLISVMKTNFSQKTRFVDFAAVECLDSCRWRSKNQIFYRDTFHITAAAASAFSKDLKRLKPDLFK